MSVFVDELSPCVPSERWPYQHYCHLFGDTEAELHRFAARLGLRREWFQAHEWLPHYDLTLGMQEKAVGLGAILTRLEVRRRWEARRNGHKAGAVEGATNADRRTALVGGAVGTQ